MPSPANDPPRLPSKMMDDHWGMVALEQTSSGIYEGTYSETYKRAEGKIRLEWSTKQNRFVGNWSEDRLRFGLIAIRVYDDGRIRGSRSTDSSCEINPGVPALQEVAWFLNLRGKQ